MRPEDTVNVVGSFNGWKKAAGSKDWKMKKEKDVYVLEKPYEQLDVKGESGFSEFKFIKNNTEWQELNDIDDKYIHGNNLWINRDVFRQEEEISGYKLSENLKKVTFIYQPAIYDSGFEKNDEIFVLGTFNEWAEAIGDSDWQLEKTQGGVYILEKDVSEIDAPGGSGYPEIGRAHV